MKKLSFKQKMVGQIPLGIAVIAVALAVGLAPPTAQAQECSAIQESYFDNLQGCVNPPATEEECHAFAAERERIEYGLHNDNVLEIQNLYKEAVGTSIDIYNDELDALIEI